MIPSDFPYKGTMEELRQINGELAELHAQRAELNLQEATLQEHKLHVLRLIREKT